MLRLILGKLQAVLYKTTEN